MFWPHRIKICFAAWNNKACMFMDFVLCLMWPIEGFIAVGIPILLHMWLDNPESLLTCLTSFLLVLMAIVGALYWNFKEIGRLLLLLLKVWPYSDFSKKSSCTVVTFDQCFSSKLLLEVHVALKQHWTHVMGPEGKPLNNKPLTHTKIALRLIG